MAIREKYKILENLPAANGRTQIVIQCPFCDETFNAYIRSMAGNGKKCPGCSAIHYYRSGVAQKNG